MAFGKKGKNKNKKGQYPINDQYFIHFQLTDNFTPNNNGAVKDVWEATNQALQQANYQILDTTSPYFSLTVADILLSSLALEAEESGSDIEYQVVELIEQDPETQKLVGRYDLKGFSLDGNYQNIFKIIADHILAEEGASYESKKDYLADIFDYAIEINPNITNDDFPKLPTKKQYEAITAKDKVFDVQIPTINEPIVQVDAQEPASDEKQSNPVDEKPNQQQDSISQSKSNSKVARPLETTQIDRTKIYLADVEPDFFAVQTFGKVNEDDDNYPNYRINQAKQQANQKLVSLVSTLNTKSQAKLQKALERYERSTDKKVIKFNSEEENDAVAKIKASVVDEIKSDRQKAFELRKTQIEEERDLKLEEEDKRHRRIVQQIKDEANDKLIQLENELDKEFEVKANQKLELALAQTREEIDSRRQRLRDTEVKKAEQKIDTLATELKEATQSAIAEYIEEATHHFDEVTAEATNTHLNAVKIVSTKVDSQTKKIDEQQHQHEIELAKQETANANALNQQLQGQIAQIATMNKRSATDDKMDLLLTTMVDKITKDDEKKAKGFTFTPLAMGLTGLGVALALGGGLMVHQHNQVQAKQQLAMQKRMDSLSAKNKKIEQDLQDKKKKKEEEKKKADKKKKEDEKKKKDKEKAKNKQPGHAVGAMGGARGQVSYANNLPSAAAGQSSGRRTSNTTSHPYSVHRFVPAQSSSHRIQYGDATGQVQPQWVKAQH